VPENPSEVTKNRTFSAAEEELSHTLRRDSFASCPKRAAIAEWVLRDFARRITLIEFAEIRLVPNSTVF